MTEKNDGISGIKVLGGKVAFPKMTNKLEQKEYDLAKMHLWLHMLNEGNRPVKWLKANSKGTAVNFETIPSQEVYDVGIAELKVFVAEINKTYGLDITLDTGEKK